MGLFDFMQTKKSTSELEEENEELRIQNENEDLKLSLAQKKKLRDNGLSLKNFGGSVKSAIAWIKNN
jgi:hypothetical protein